MPGACRLVRIDLETGEQTPLAESPIPERDWVVTRNTHSSGCGAVDVLVGLGDSEGPAEYWRVRLVP